MLYTEARRGSEGAGARCSGSFSTQKDLDGGAGGPPPPLVPDELSRSRDPAMRREAPIAIYGINFKKDAGFFREVNGRESRGPSPMSGSPYPVVTIEAIVEDFRESVLTKYVGLACLTLMVWDHIITFNDEVEYIWHGKKGALAYLFFLNRYLIPLSFIVNICAYFNGGWKFESCHRFVVYEGALTMIGLTIVGIMMFLRIQALYRRSLLIQGVVLFVLVAFIGVNSWLLSTAEAVFHIAYPLVKSCSMIFHPKVASIAAASAWLPLLYDTVVVALTLYRTIGAVWSKTAGQIVRVLLQEGLLYYSVIFSVTLVLTVMILAAPQGVRNLTAQLELCLTVTMMSRITLHLKRFAHKNCKSYEPSDCERSPSMALSWDSVTRPARAGMRRGRVRHIQRAADDSFFAMVTMGRGTLGTVTGGGTHEVDEEIFVATPTGPSGGPPHLKRMESQRMDSRDGQ